MELFNLSGKRALITGSTKGIGEAIAKRFAEHGAKVVISSRKEDMCIKIRDKINKEFPDSAISIPCNINEKNQLENLVNETNSNYLVDGQHRYESIKELYKNESFPHAQGR